MAAGTHQSKIIHLATDHAGFALKESVRDWLRQQGYTVVDHGAIQFSPEDDFPDFIQKAAAAVSKQPAAVVGIVFGGSGQGEAMAANRFPHVRATTYYAPDIDIITLSRTHNDANVLAIGARFVSFAAACEAIEAWLTTPFVPEEKRVRRNRKLEMLNRTTL